MKQNLQRTSEWIELFLNYAVVFGIEIALNAPKSVQQSEHRRKIVQDQPLYEPVQRTF